jgi:hypothetical protein
MEDIDTEIIEEDIDSEIIEEIIEEIIDDQDQIWEDANQTNAEFSLHLRRQSDIQDDITTSPSSDSKTSSHNMSGDTDPFSSVSREDSSPDDFAADSTSPVSTPVPAPAPIFNYSASSPSPAPVPAPVPIAVRNIPAPSPAPSPARMPFDNKATPAPAPLPRPTQIPAAIDFIGTPTPAPIPAPTPSPAPIPNATTPTSAPFPAPFPTRDPAPPHQTSSDETTEDPVSQNGDDNLSFEEATIATSMLPPPPPPPPPPQQKNRRTTAPRAPLPPPSRPPPPPIDRSASSAQADSTSDGSVPTGPEFKTKPIPNLRQASNDEDFDPDSTLIRPVEMPSPSLSDDTGPIEVPLDWFDDIEPTTPIVSNANNGDSLRESLLQDGAPPVICEEEEGSTLEEESFDEEETIEEIGVIEDVTQMTPEQDIVAAEEGKSQAADEKDKATEEQTTPSGDVKQEYVTYYEAPPQYLHDTQAGKFETSFFAMGCICLIFLLLCCGAIFLLLGIVTKSVPPFNEDDINKPVSTTPPSSPSFVGDQVTTPMDPFVPGQCDFGGQEQPNILSQCSCTGQVKILSEDVRLKYEALKLTFANQIYGTWGYPSESCEPANQALLWLSSVVSVDETDLTQRFVLAMLYYSTSGKLWVSQQNWLEQVDVCSWYGISCSGQLVSFVELASNNLAGPVSANSFALLIHQILPRSISQ